MYVIVFCCIVLYCIILFRAMFSPIVSSISLLLPAGVAQHQPAAKPEAVVTVICSWWWAKTSPETIQYNKIQYNKSSETIQYLYHKKYNTRSCSYSDMRLMMGENFALKQYNKIKNNTIQYIARNNITQYNIFTTKNTILEAVVTVICAWWWTKTSPETIQYNTT